ncbi:hypothetical protein SY88_21470 [Clostridiales bacterium PH28_bin88]|nr:hypothetical protein SY88_21470 [Clostridiales bacterium PH28_bin88]
MRLILASASPRREELLRQVGLECEVIPSGISEDITPAAPHDYEFLVRELALGKARWVARGIDNGLVIGADTVVVLGHRILGKPGSPEEAGNMLRELSGKPHQVLTGIAVVKAGSNVYRTDCEVTRVYFRRLEEREIEAYVESGEPMDKAGAYGIQGLGAVLVERIEGCYFNVVGLPLARLTQVLRGFGVNVLGGGD